jgi:hypothetical protein
MYCNTPKQHHYSLNPCGKNTIGTALYNHDPDFK